MSENGYHLSRSQSRAYGAIRGALTAVVILVAVFGPWIFVLALLAEAWD